MIIYVRLKSQLKALVLIVNLVAFNFVHLFPQ